MVLQCGAGARLNGDQRQLTGSGSALEVLRNLALYKSTYFTSLLYGKSMHLICIH